MAAAAVFTVLGATGVTSVQTLSSVVLALLAILAISQLRGREETRALISSWRRSRTDLFEASFPDSYYYARARAGHSYCFAGMTMQRTLPTMRVDLERILANGGSVRLLLPDPDDEVLMSMVAASRQNTTTPQRAAELIRQALMEMRTIGPGKRAEVRVTSVLPRVGLNVIDADQPGAFVMVQMYQLRPRTEPGPIFALTTHDGHWFHHFRDEFEHVWAEGREWQSD
ncbi:DUF5919 domain-containing protein [Nocardioides cynanchi]|uniref:DUF5919 domain-containing protein n=1 Tax=Nocardioides cynanchi TaxID=2558918 RepID=UPI001246FE60|nr:DUF5919 domain-containing protein [Nocardioides cynanchi]